MKTITYLFFLFINVYAFAQVTEQKQGPQKPFIEYKDGSRLPVSKPIVVCDSLCYFINRTNKLTCVVPLTQVQGFSKGADVRWMTFERFRSIGVKPVHGYFWGAVTIYPTFFGVFILSDTVKRKHMKQMYKDAKRNY